MEKGSIVHIDYELWVVESNELIETTSESVARSQNKYDKSESYKPRPLIVGVGKVIKGLDDSLLQAEVGKEYEIEIPPEKAYGERDPKLIELYPKQRILRCPEFRKRRDRDESVEPGVGMTVTVGNRVGTITYVSTGRVRVDFNKPLAGRTLRYKYKVIDEAKSPEDKIFMILEMYYGSSQDFGVKLEDKHAMIKLPDACKYDMKWFTVKHQVAKDLHEYADIAVTRFIEEHVPKVKPPAPPPEAVEKQPEKELAPDTTAPDTGAGTEAGTLESTTTNKDVP
jgi:FKBP-type peptidyl-prolyl cis-trans isomerase 2